MSIKRALYVGALFIFSVLVIFLLQDPVISLIFFLVFLLIAFGELIQALRKKQPFLKVLWLFIKKVWEHLYALG